ncbi:MAG: RNA 2'-phosphotransferase [Candidatus Hydrothermarchaeales archaeon]
MKDYTHLSKFLCYLLRHHPERLGLELDGRGFTRVTVDRLAELIREETTHKWVEAGDIYRVAESDPNGRFEIKDERIRCTYGHSVPVDLEYESCRGEELPDLLYHGTTQSAAEEILKSGLRPRHRQHVHLSTSIAQATRVGKRRTGRPTILKVRARKAAERGIRFWKVNDLVFLSEDIPPEFIQA